jgi:hypothetical protein
VEALKAGLSKKFKKTFFSYQPSLVGACLRDLPPPKRFGEGWSRYGEGWRPTAE